MAIDSNKQSAYLIAEVYQTSWVANTCKQAAARGMQSCSGFLCGCRSLRLDVLSICQYLLKLRSTHHITPSDEIIPLKNIIHKMHSMKYRKQP